ncbi:hypothetical protein GWC95_18250 [Sediminibacterium roseum]|uniref:Glutathione synthase/RimK-type ligase, ATP-grasp superfamily n=1 Tax=Sediminibacterium roseum TaxID=1978412 RepID=A0ABW9ZXH9_9BACT|nr:hypothetical protein [Sediminibacterium roseum]NCI51872.1 hypothetical protein [Sediminibacterium roseum]
MDKLKVLGVKRGSRFSPNHVVNDDSIFSLVTAALREKNCEVTLCREDEFLALENIEQPFIFTMAREKQVVAKLKKLEAEGKRIINSGHGIENCFRHNMTTTLVGNNIPYPKSYIVSTSEPGNAVFEKLTGKGFWIKRGDFHAIHKEDVTFVESIQQGNNILNEFALRDIPDAVVSEHLFGDLVKFYGVSGTDFFFSFYPYDHNHLKYSEHESVNGQTAHYPFDKNKLQETAFRSAEVLNIHVFGGDAIVDKNGNFHIIDMNDWPSFAPCREEAVPQIAACIYNYFNA